MPGSQSSANSLFHDSPWLQTLHVIGSIASITGLSLLTLNKALPAISIGDIVAWLLAIPLLLAAGTSLAQGFLALYVRIAHLVGETWWRVIALVAIPAGILLLAIVFQLLRHFFVPVASQLIVGR